MGATFAHSGTEMKSREHLPNVWSATEQEESSGFFTAFCNNGQNLDLVSRSKQWTALGELAPKKAKCIPSAGKVMASVYWYVKEILLVNYFREKPSLVYIKCIFWTDLRQWLQRNVLEWWFDFFGFPFVSKARQKFVCSEEAIQVVNDCFEGLEENHFRVPGEMLGQVHWTSRRLCWKIK